jgi:2-polyprenyl-3-methyl-5-hydroxy-6-metoxy-1,4-benzoquinol methylase
LIFMTEYLEAYKTYSAHYQTMGNKLPNWALAKANPSAFACKKPWVPKKRDAVILDFGFGWGHQILELWCAGFRDITGVEISASQVEHCKANCPEQISLIHSDGCEFLEKNAERRFDLILLNDVIEHLSKDIRNRALSLIYKSLNPGGTLVIRTPNMSSLLATFSRYIDDTHVHGYTEVSLMQVLSSAGFSNLQLVPDDWGWNSKGWSPFAPWRGLGFRGLFNHLLHKILYGVRLQYPKPTRYGINIEAWCKRPIS